MSLVDEEARGWTQKSGRRRNEGAEGIRTQQKKAESEKSIAQEVLGGWG